MKLSSRALTVLGNSGFRDWTDATPERVRKHLLDFGREDIYAMMRRFRQCGHGTAMEIMRYAGLKLPAVKRRKKVTRIIRIYLPPQLNRKEIKRVTCFVQANVETAISEFLASNSPKIKWKEWDATRPKP